MSKRGLIAAGAVALALGAVVTLSLGGGTSDAVRGDPSAPSEKDPSGVVRHMILQDADLENGPDYALMLHPLATGGDWRVVTDQTALRAAQPTAYYTDKPGETMKLLLLSILFMSPPGNPPDGRFATLIRGKEEVKSFTCAPVFCTSGEIGGDARHQRDLAGLLEASKPVELITERFAHPDKVRAAHFKALRDESIVLIEPAELPPPGTIMYPARVRLDLPAVLLDTDESGNTPLTPFDEAEYRARFVAAFTHAYPETDAYRLGPIDFSYIYPPQTGWPVVSDAFEGYLYDEQEHLRGIDRIMVVKPYLLVDLTPRLADALMGPDPFSRMPDFAREPETLAPRLDALAEEVLSRPCPGCFKIELPVKTVDAIRVTRSKPPTFTLSYFRIADDEPSAQQ